MKEINVINVIKRIKLIKKKTSAAGFEPARVTPVDFESTSLTTRTY